MLKRTLFLLLLCVFLPSMTAFAQSEQEQEQGDLWISLGGEASMYSYSNIALGGSLALGFGRGTSMGFKATWFFSLDGLNTLELCFILRFYLLGSQSISGPFLQLDGGPAFFYSRDENISFPAKYGTISAGLNFGWRFLFNNRWYIEPSVRGGYPYLAGVGISAGVRF